MPHLIDSDILVDYLRHIEAAANYLDSIADWSVSVVTGLELIAGAKDKREVAEIDLVLGAYHAVDLLRHRNLRPSAESSARKYSQFSRRLPQRKRSARTCRHTLHFFWP